MNKPNYLGIVISVVVYGAFGAAYYAEALLGSAWVQAQGKSFDQISPEPMPFVYNFFGSLLMAILMDQFMQKYEIKSVSRWIEARWNNGNFICCFTIINPLWFSRPFVGTWVHRWTERSPGTFNDWSDSRVYLRAQIKFSMFSFCPETNINPYFFNIACSREAIPLFY